LGGYFDVASGGIFALYGLVALIYLCAPVLAREKPHKPAGMLLPFLLASVVIPDVYHADTQSCSAWVTVGGDGGHDGILIRPLGVFLMYGLLATAASYSAS
jgi:hypothetical protein